MRVQSKCILEVSLQEVGAIRKALERYQTGDTEEAYFMANLANQIEMEINGQT